MSLLLLAALALAAAASAVPVHGSPASDSGTSPAPPRRPSPTRAPARPTPAPVPTPRPTPLRPPAPPGLSWQEADALEATILSYDERWRARRPAPAGTVVATARQINSYLNLTLGPKLPPGVSGLELALQPERLVLRARLDLDRIKQSLPRGANLGLLGFLSGPVPVELSGRLASARGSGRVELESAVVGGVSLPPSFLAQLVSLSTRTAQRPQGIDLGASFPLPWAAERLRLDTGRACLDFLPAAAPAR